MTRSRTNQARQELGRILEYALLRRPDEFGLYPEEGRYRLKDVLKALAEDGRQVRESQIKELNTLAVADGLAPPYILEGGAIAPTAQTPPEPEDVWEVPVLLYGFCRRKAHRHVMERGLAPSTGEWVLLSPDREKAILWGTRVDRQPVLVTVRAEEGLRSGVLFRCLGDHLYLATELGPHLLDMPALPKERPEKEVPAKPEKGPRMPQPDHSPGSIELGLEQVFEDPREKKKRKQEQARSKKKWQQERRKKRRGRDQW